MDVAVSPDQLLARHQACYLLWQARTSGWPLSTELRQRRSCWLPSGMATLVAAALPYNPLLASLACFLTLRLIVLPFHALWAAPGVGVIDM